MSIICLCGIKNRCPVNIHTVIRGSFVRNSRWLSIKFLCVTLWHMSIGAGVVATIPFQQVDAAPHAEASAQGNNEGLKDFDCGVKKFHGSFLLYKKSLRPVGYTPEISFFIAAGRSEG